MYQYNSTPTISWELLLILIHFCSNLLWYFVQRHSKQPQGHNYTRFKHTLHTLHTLHTHLVCTHTHTHRAHTHCTHCTLSCKSKKRHTKQATPIPLGLTLLSLSTHKVNAYLHTTKDPGTLLTPNLFIPAACRLGWREGLGFVLLYLPHLQQ